MSHAKATKIVLTKRDCQLFHFLFKAKVSTLGQINKYFFSGISPKTVGRRLNKLSNANLITKDVFFCNGSPKISYGLGLKGLEKIREKLPYSVPGKPQKSDSPEHDIILNEVRIALLSSNRINSCLSENELQFSPDFRDNIELKPFVDLHSDGVLCLSNEYERVNVALEYEATVKSQTRYRDKLTEYYKHSSIPAVFYVCHNNAILKVVQSAEREIVKDSGKKFKFYYSELKNVIGDADEVTFENLSGRIFRF